jgi:hypothetical protein
MQGATATFSSMGEVLQDVASTLSIDMAKRGAMPPLLQMMRKEIVTSNLIKFDVSLPVGVAQTATVGSPVLFPTFPAPPDTGIYNWDKYIEAYMTIGTHKVFDLMKILDSDVTIAASRGKGSVQKLYQKAVTASLSRLMTYMESGIVNGNGIMTGFNQLFGQSAYGGITHTLADYTGKVDNVDYFSFWKPYSATYSVGGLTVTGNDGQGAGKPPTSHALATGATLVDAFDTFDLQLQLKDRPFAVIVTTPEIAVNYSSLYRREASWTISNGQVGSAELGVTRPTYRGRPIVTMNGLPANTVYFMDFKDIYLATLAVNGNVPNDFLESNNVGGLSIGVGALGKDTAEVSRFEMYTIPQLVVEDTRALNRLVIAA